MDCYFRQYWRDTRLSFKGLKMNSNQLHINQLSLNVKMLGTIALNLQLNFSFSLWYIWKLRYFIKPDWEQLLRKNLEAWHLLSQRSGLLPAHHHQAEQTVQDLWEWRHHLLHEVSKAGDCGVWRWLFADWQLKPGVRWCCRIFQWTGSRVPWYLALVSVCVCDKCWNIYVKIFQSPTPALRSVTGGTTPPWPWATRGSCSCLSSTSSTPSTGRSTSPGMPPVRTNPAQSCPF